MINFTIVVQAINFFIICIILRKFLFIPAINVLESEEKEQKSLENKISLQQSLLYKKATKKIQLWQEYQSCFKKIYPSIKPKKPFAFKNIVKEPEISKLTAKELKHFEEHMQKTLMERIANLPK